MRKSAMLVAAILILFPQARARAGEGSSSGGGGSGLITASGRRVLWDLVVANGGRALDDASTSANHLKEGDAAFPLELSRVDFRWKWGQHPIPNPAIGLAARLIDERRELPATLRAFLRFTLQYNLLASRTSLPLSFDAEGTYVPPSLAESGKRLEAIAWFLPEIGLLLHEGRFNSLGTLSQAGLLIHESLRRIQFLVGPVLSVRQIQDLTAAICLRRPELLPRDFLQRFTRLVGNEGIFERFFGADEVQNAYFDDIRRAEGHDNLGFIWAYSGWIKEMALLERIQHFLNYAENRLRLKGLQLSLSGPVAPQAQPAVFALRRAVEDRLRADDRRPDFDSVKSGGLLGSLFSGETLAQQGGLRIEDDYGFDGKLRGVCGEVTERLIATKLVDSLEPGARAHVLRACQRTPYATWQDRPSVDQGLNEYVRPFMEEYWAGLMAQRIGDARLKAEGWTPNKLQFLMYSVRELENVRNRLGGAGNTDSMHRYLLRQVNSVNAFVRLYLIHQNALPASFRWSPSAILDGYVGD